MRGHGRVVSQAKKGSESGAYLECGWAGSRHRMVKLSMELGHSWESRYGMVKLSLELGADERKCTSHDRNDMSCGL